MERREPAVFMPVARSMKSALRRDTLRVAEHLCRAVAKAGRRPIPKEPSFTVVQRADETLYAAKSWGRNRACRG